MKCMDITTDRTASQDSIATAGTTATDTVIAVNGLRRTYGTGSKAFEAVAGISFEVRRGEVFGLLGTNGAGKTSSLDVIEGLAEPTDGTVEVLGFDPFRERAKVRPDMGIMLQSGGLPSQLTVFETMRMWHGTCSAPLPIDEVLADVELEHRRDVAVEKLSGGEQRRLDLACALLGDPKVLFLDEPTTGLDPESRRRTWDLLRRLKARGVSMVLTTHYLEEAELLADRIAIMHRGQVKSEGTVSEIVGSASSTISFVTPSADLPEIPGFVVSQDGAKTVIETTELQGDSLRVLMWAQKEGVVLSEFEAKPASLESVFIEISRQS